MCCDERPRASHTSGDPGPFLRVRRRGGYRCWAPTRRAAVQGWADLLRTLGAEAIPYAADHGAHVVNASWGGSVGGSALTALRSAVAYAASKGVLVVAATGNDGTDRDTSAVYPASLTESNVLTVGSSTAADRASGFSAYGATSVDLFAPGELVFTTWNDGSYRLVSGTSIASPQVAAAYAL